MLGAYDTITIWNRYRDPATKKDEWFRHVIHDCSWEDVVDSTVSGSGTVVDSAYYVAITQNALYRPYPVWFDLSADDKAKFFTFNVEELVARGDVPIVITGVAPFTEALVKSRLLPDAFTVKAVVDSTEAYKRGRHYEISGV